MLEKHSWNSFLLYLVVEILEVAREINSFQDVLFKRGVLKNISNLSGKHKKLWSGGVLPKDIFKNFIKFTEKNIFARAYFLIKLQTGNLKLAEAATRDCL